MHPFFYAFSAGIRTTFTEFRVKQVVTKQSIFVYHST